MQCRLDWSTTNRSHRLLSWASTRLTTWPRATAESLCTASHYLINGSSTGSFTTWSLMGSMQRQSKKSSDYTAAHSFYASYECATKWKAGFTSATRLLWRLPRCLPAGFWPLEFLGASLLPRMSRNSGYRCCPMVCVRFQDGTHRIDVTRYALDTQLNWIWF